MRKLLAEPRAIEMRFDGERPVAVRVGGRWRAVVRVLDYWREAGRWWDGEPEREFMRIEAGGLLVVGRTRGGGEGGWFLYAIED